MNAIAHYTSAFASSESGLAGSAVDWLRALRREAAKHLESGGFPTTRDEAWRYTDVTPLLAVPFASVKASNAQKAEELAERSTIPGAHRFVFVDGTFVVEASHLAGLPEGVIVTNLAVAVGTHAAQVRPLLGALVPASHHGFAALNTAMMNDGALIIVPRGVRVEQPIEIIVVASDNVQPTASHLRHLVILEDNAEAVIVEHYVGGDNTVSFTNSVTEARVAANASLTHVKVQREGMNAFHVSTVAFEQARSSRVRSCSIAVGGALARTEISSNLAGEGADCQMFGTYITRARQLVDHQTFIDHAVPHCTSNELYKGVLSGMSRGVFNGKILVRKDAQKTAAFQSNRNLVLSDNAVVDTRPQLEIYADDVKCSHGATIGRLDDEALFYLRSRGISRAEARALLTSAFAAEVVESVTAPTVRALVEETVNKALARELSGALS